MSQVDFTRATCPCCTKRLLIRPDQVGRRVRCPKCRNAFTAHPAVGQSNPIPTGIPVTEPEDDTIIAEAANEILLARDPPRPPRLRQRAKLTAHFERTPDLVYKACVQAVRSTGCEIITVNRANRTVRFCLGNGADATAEHELFVFEAEDGSSDLDITAFSPQAKAEVEPYYEGIAKEASKYLMFAGESRQLALPPGDDRRRLKPHRGGTILTLGILSLVFHCIPMGIIAWVMGHTDLAAIRGGEMDRTGEGSTRAGMICGIISSILFAIGAIGAVVAFVFSAVSSVLFW